MIPNIVHDIEESLKADQKVLAHRSNWASLLGGHCLRQLVYYRTDWDKLTPPDTRLQGIFNTGTKLERVVKNILNEVGRDAKPQWELVESGIKLNDKLLAEFQIGSEPDTFLKVWPETNNGERSRILGPVDLKSCHPNIFAQLDGMETFKRYVWMESYIPQLTIYEIGSNFETGWFLFFNKTNLWDCKLIEVPLDYALAENLLKKAKTVNEHIASETLPDKINDANTCPRCPFFSFCCPDITTGGNLQIIDNEELTAILDRMAEVEPAADEYAELEKARDKILTKGQDIACGNWLITWRKIVKHFKSQSAKDAFDREEWHKTIVHV